MALSCDGSLVKESDLARSGMILRDSNGAVIFFANRYLFFCKDKPEAEISALFEGLSTSMQWSDLPIVIQFDSSIVIAALTDNWLDHSAYGYLMLAIKKIPVPRGFIP